MVSLTLTYAPFICVKGLSQTSMNHLKFTKALPRTFWLANDAVTAYKISESEPCEIKHREAIMGWEMSKLAGKSKNEKPPTEEKGKKKNMKKKVPE